MESDKENLIGSGNATPRSPLLMNRFDTAVIVVDVQEKLLPHIADGDEMVFNIERILEAANEIQLPVFVSEQYPKGLGHTVSDFGILLDSFPVYEKSMFSIRECEQLWEQLQQRKIKNVLLVGIETHVCVFQSAMDLLANGYDVFVCIDAVGSRHEEDYMTAMQRMETSGVTLVTTEMALFEWCEKAGTPEFKVISKLVQREFVPLHDGE